MKAYQQEFIEFAIGQEVLQFGEFTLKSGRISPYFFNAGKFNTGESLARLGSYYASALLDTEIKFDLLLGPAYKGIPLVSAISIALFNEHGQSWPYVYNRKEEKEHGEGGTLVGAELTGNVVIIDDVITAGTAIREVISLVESSAANVCGAVVAIDRQEKGPGGLSAIQEVERDYGVSVASIVKLTDIVEYLETSGRFENYFDQIKSYQLEYGVDYH